MLMLFSEQARGRPTCLLRAQVARGRHVDDPYSLLSLSTYNVKRHTRNRSASTPDCGLVASASGSVLVVLEFASRSDLTKTLQVGTVTFLPGAQCVHRVWESLQGLKL